MAYATTATPITITNNTINKFIVEIDRIRFERLVDSLGLFTPEVLTSLKQSEADIRTGRVKKLRSLRDLRKHS